MTVVYFDRNAFADICGLRQGFTEADVAKLQNAVDAGAVVIPASYTVIEETVSLLHDSEEAYSEQIKTVLNLINKHRIIKPHHDLIRDDCLSYGQKANYVRTTKTPKRFEEILNLSINRISLSALAGEIREFYARIAASRQDEFDRLIAETKRRGFSGFCSFQQVWDTTSPIILEGVVNRLPRIAKRLCKKRGLEPMLNIRSIRISVIYECWLLYSHWLKQDGTPGKVKPSEAGDFFHAICSSAADIFVTQEHREKYGKLPFILNQIPIPRFTVMNLSQFLGFLDS